jgi:hypothetical protein
VKITDMFDRVVLKSGQFVLKRRNIDIDIDAFRLLVEDTLAIYSRAVPFDKTYRIPIGAAIRQFTFDEFFDPEVARVPDWLSEVTPVRPIGPSVSTFGVVAGISEAHNVNPNLIDPTQAPWNYTKPVLTVPFSSHYTVIAVYNHWIEDIKEENDNKPVYAVPKITFADSVFFDILTAKFIQGVGRSRRAFTLNDMPIIMDADAMINEGETMFEKAMEDIQNVQKFYLGSG